MNSVTRVLETPELISFIFVLLKAEKEKWKGHAASLAIVNRFFFYASIGVVWEEMHSFEPFCTILVPSKVASAPTSFSRDAWQRFSLYSTKTKTLVLIGPSSLSRSQYWASLVGTSNPTQDKLFPSLRIVFLNSMDPLSLYITSAVCPHIKCLSVCLPPVPSPVVEEAVLTLTMTVLSRQARSLVAAQLAHPLSSQSLDNLLTIKSLRSVFVWMTVGDHGLIKPSFWAPQFLIIGQKLMGSPPNIPGYTAFRDGTNQSMSRLEPVLAGRRPLRALQVMGRSQLHSMLAHQPCAPAPFQRFDGICLMVWMGDHAEVELLSTATIAKFLDPNPTLAVLKVCGSQRGVLLHPQAQARARANPIFHNTELFLNKLSALRNLTSIVIESIHFPSGNIIHQMLDVLRGSPKLTVFRFLPLPLSVSSVDALALPPVSCLEGISMQCPKLVDLGITVNLFKIDTLNSPPNDPLGTSKLRRLFLPRMCDDFPNYTGEDRGRVAEYLYRLFPNLVPMASQWKEPSVGRVFWQEIDVMYSKLGASRE